MKLKPTLRDSRDAQIAVTIALFFLSACIANILSFQHTEIPIWPPSGVAFALIMLMGSQAWPGITIGSLLSFLLMGSWIAYPPSTIVIVGMSFAFSHTVEALAGTFFLNKWVRQPFPFRTTNGTFQFLFVACAMCLISAIPFTLTQFFAGLVEWDRMLKTAISWFTGNLVGILLFTPFIVSLFRKRYSPMSTEKALEMALFLLGAGGVIFLLQVEYFSETLQKALPFLILPFFLWLAFRFDLVVVTAGALTVSLLAVYFTIQGQGPFVLDEAYHSVLLLQIFIVVMSISSLVLSATVKERVSIQRKLEAFNDNLEAKVLERTHALHEEISTRKEAESKLQRTNQELSKRNSELDNFVYSVSHDLRAPIASVLGLINLARKDKDLSMKETYLEMINNSALQQDHFIREILDQSRNSRLEVKREEVLFRPIIDETFNQLAYATPSDKEVERIISINQHKPFYCDRWRLKVILNNVISNAIRYRNGRDPVIRVHVNVSEIGAELCVEDNGRGIAREHLNNVFRMFYRATDDGAGSGLGLYIVKETVEKLNGAIKIESTEGKGTTVRLLIPEVNLN